MSRRNLFVGVLVCALCADAHAQGTGTGDAQTVDDFIARVIREAAATDGPGKTTLPVVMGVRINDLRDRTRFVVEFSDPVSVRTFLLSNPDRIVIDMPSVQWRIAGSSRPSGSGPVKSYRYGLFRPGNSRFVIDLRGPVAVSDPVALPPEHGQGYRLVIDLTPTTQEAFDQRAGWPADLKAQETQAERTASVPMVGQNLQRKVIVIDPGHGGIDSGTNGINGMMEKDLVLDEGTRLAHALLKTGPYIVHLTRDTDIYVPLRERRDIARSWRADLFISLHADSNPDRSVRGLSVYTLSESGSDREAVALARKENQSDVIAGVDLGGENSTVAPILIDLEQRDTLNRSSRFAIEALSQLRDATDILGREPHRAAAFAVLKAPDVPSVLVELGYLSNAEDAAQMNSTRWRDAVADAIASAVAAQFHPPTTVGESVIPVAQRSGRE